MAPREFLDVDPRTLHLPTNRLSGADPVKLHDQMARFGSNVSGMPPLLAYRGSDGAIMIYDGVTRATRVAKLLPGATVRVEVMRALARPVGRPETNHRRPVAMTNGELKQEILRALSDLVVHTPDLRFGQLIANLAVIARGPFPESVWDMEDDELLAATKSHIEDYDRRHAEVAQRDYGS